MTGWVISPCGDDGLLAEFNHRHWRAMGIAEAEIAPGWRAACLDFIATARRERDFAGLVAWVGGEAVGCACSHRVERVFPAFRTRDAAVLGYVWGVYVTPPHRGRGIGAALVRASVERLAALGCGRVLLHAGEESRALYERLGFRGTDELGLDVLG